MCPGMIRFNWLVNFLALVFEYNWDSLHTITLTSLQFNLHGLTDASSYSYRLIFLRPIQSASLWWCRQSRSLECQLIWTMWHGRQPENILLNSVAMKAPTHTSVLWLKDDAEACKFKKVITCITLTIKRWGWFLNFTIWFMKNVLFEQKKYKIMKKMVLCVK